MRTSALLFGAIGRSRNQRARPAGHAGRALCRCSDRGIMHASAWCRNTRLQESVYLFVMVAGGRPARPKGGQGSGLTVRARFSQ